MNSRRALVLSGFLLLTAFAHAQANFLLADSGLKYLITESGGGTQVKPGKVVVFHYVGSLRDGTVFADSHKSGEPVVFTVGKGKVIKGWEEGFLRLHDGDKASFVLPPQLGYGEAPPAGVPKGATVRFDVELLAVKNERLIDKLRAAIATSGVAAAQSLVSHEESEKFAKTFVSEADLQQLAAEYQQEGKASEQTFVLKLATHLYPKSAGK